MIETLTVDSRTTKTKVRLKERRFPSYHGWSVYNMEPIRGPRPEFGHNRYVGFVWRKYPGGDVWWTGHRATPYISFPTRREAVEWLLKEARK